MSASDPVLDGETGHSRRPRPFIAHASEDKDRFVLPFAKALIQRGLDPWVDKWEINPGDSLVQKIFEEGLSKAPAIIVVLSRYSVEKPWVKEEIDAAFVRKVEGTTRIIPIVLDECAIPECLKHIRYERIQDIDSFDQEADAIAAVILDRSDKPSLGAFPAYAQQTIPHSYGLKDIDVSILKVIGDLAMESGYPYLDSGPVVAQANTIDINDALCQESLEVLDRRMYIEGQKFLGSNDIKHLRMTSMGIEEYASLFFPEYAQFKTRVIAAIVNDKLADNYSIIRATGQPQLLVNHFLEDLANQGLCRISKSMGGGLHIHVFGVSPELKRLLS